MQQQADIIQYRINLSRPITFGKDYKAKGRARRYVATAATSLEGTQTGAIMAGADPMTMVIKALADFAMSIENVNKFFNPLTTVLEGARPLMELFLNSVLQDGVNQLTTMGSAISKMLAPFLSLTQLFFLFSNVLYTMLLVPLELVGNGLLHGLMIMF